jgi:hypothetical protein
MPPFKSRSQARLMFAKDPEMAKEFAAHTKSIKALPEHVKPKVSEKSDNPYLTTKNEWFIDMGNKPPEGFEDCKNVKELFDESSKRGFTFTATERFTTNPFKKQ